MRTPFFVSVILLIMFAGLILIASFPGAQSSEIPDLKRSKSQQAYKNRNLLLFQKKEEGGNFHLTYGWKGFKEVSYLMTFTVSKEDLLTSEKEIGYVLEDLDLYVEEGLKPLREEMISFLSAFTHDLIKKSPYRQYFILNSINSMSFNIKISAPREIYDKVKEEFSRMTSMIADEQNIYFKRLRKERSRLIKSFIEGKGLRYYGEKIGVNYGLCVKNNRHRVRHVVEKLKNLNPKKTLAGFFTVLLSFIQRIKYGIPPFKEGDRLTLGFWSPPKIFVSNLGDCDSKSVAFAALWTNFRRYPLLLIKIPNHMFIGLAVPVSMESGIVINGLRYTLCEVSGPDIWPPGLISSYSRMYIDSGRFSYELIR